MVQLQDTRSCWSEGSRQLMVFHDVSMILQPWMFRSLFLKVHSQMCLWAQIVCPFSILRSLRSTLNNCFRMLLFYSNDICNMNCIVMIQNIICLFMILIICLFVCPLYSSFAWCHWAVWSHMRSYHVLMFLFWNGRSHAIRTHPLTNFLMVGRHALLFAKVPTLTMINHHWPLWTTIFDHDWPSENIYYWWFAREA